MGNLECGYWRWNWRKNTDNIIDPATGEAADWMEIPAILVTQEMVAGGGVDVTNLETVAGEAYSDRSWMPSSEWMVALLGD